MSWQPHLLRAECASPLGAIVLLASPRGLRRVFLSPAGEMRRSPEGGERPGDRRQGRLRRDAAALATAMLGEDGLHPLVEQVQAYLAGRQTSLDWPLDLEGSPFDLRVWEEARRIPYGSTVTYGELAATLGGPGLARAVGQALARNPVPLFIPCHRVVAGGGNLGGFSAGLGWKRFLLELEGSCTGAAAAGAALGDG